MACTFIVQVKRKVRTSVILLPQHIYYICTLREGETLMHEGEILSIHNYFLVAMACLINGIYAPQQFMHQYLNNKKNKIVIFTSFVIIAISARVVIVLNVSLLNFFYFIKCHF